MPILTSLNKKIKEPKGWKTSKKIGLALMIVATIGYSGVLTNIIPFFHTFLLGVFGLFGYILFFLMYLIGGALFAGKKYVFKIRYVIYLCLLLISILSIFHMAFLKGAVQTNYFSYLAYVYNKQLTVGGLLLGLIVFPVQFLFGQIGSYIIFAIIASISICLIIDYLSNLKNKQKVQVIKQKVKEKPKQEEQTIVFDLKESKKENVNIGLKAEIEKEETARDIALRKLGLKQEDFDEKKQIENKQEKPVEKYSDYAGTFGYNVNIKPSSTKQKSNSNEENMRFLQATMGGASYMPPKQENNANTKVTEKFSSSSNFETKADFLSANFGIPNKKINQDYNTEREEQSFNQNVKTYSNFNSYNTISVTPSTPMNTETNSHNNLSIDLDNFVLPDSLKSNIKERKIELKQAQKVENQQTSMNIEKSLNGNDIQSSLGSYNSINKQSHKNTNLSTSSDKMQQTKFEAINEIPVQEKRKKRKYNRPSLELLSNISTNPNEYGGDYHKNAEAIEGVLNSFKIPAKVINVTRGPAVTRYELEMPVGISVNKVVNYANDIAMAVASEHGVRIEAPIPGKSAVGVEVPNEKVATVSLREVLESKEFQNSNGILNFAVGKEINGNMRVCDLQKMPHMLVAGSTGSGKSVCLNTMLISMLYKYSPDDLKLILIDPKQVEFFMFNGLPHMLLKNAITDPQKAINSLKWAINEMERRYTLMTNYGVRNITEYNKLSEVVSGKVDKIPSIVIVIDEVADLMSVCSKEFEDHIRRLAAKARAAGIHIVLATQRPSVDVITGVIKANLPSRIAFAVLNYQDSKTILDKGGAEKLLGKGDMLLQTIDMPEPKRVQGCFVSDKEVKSITDYIKQNNDCYFDEEIAETINKEETTTNNVSINGDSEESLDTYFVEALKLAIETGTASASMFQRRFGIGFARAGRIVDQMTRLQYISPQDGSNKPRSVYITMDEFIKLFGDKLS